MSQQYVRSYGGGGHDDNDGTLITLIPRTFRNMVPNLHTNKPNIRTWDGTILTVVSRSLLLLVLGRE